GRVGVCAGLAEWEAGELDEHVSNRHIAAADAVKRGPAETGRNGRSAETVVVGSAEVVELEVALAIGADHAIFGRGAGIDLQRHARARNEVVEVPVALAGIAAPGRLTVRAAAIQRGVDAQVTADLDA